MDDSGIPLFERAKKHGGRTALRDVHGSFTYDRLLETSARVASGLLSDCEDLKGRRVAFLTPRSFDYPAVQWGIWRAGGIAVPLCEVHPPAELAHTVSDSHASVIVGHPDFKETLSQVAKATDVLFVPTDQLLHQKPKPLPSLSPQRPALMLYTSGTTGKPKGVVLTHANLEAQITTLIDAWEWRPDDRILHVLPLHHTHGIVNVLCCALWAGALCHMLPRFDAGVAWQTLMKNDLTLFMAVPTIYVKLISAWKASSSHERRKMSDAGRKLRLMVSGSAALPVTAFQDWKTITGHDLLERYGMTEIGMALSNPLHGRRIPGHVGVPLPGVEVRLVDDEGNPATPGTSGEIEVRGPSVFKEYWMRPEETAAVFRDSWFRTGDVAVVEKGSYRILGRRSTDIIKTGGYKVSALEIEEMLRTHPMVAEVAVVGKEDPEWGERVCAAIVPESNADISIPKLRDWAKERLAPYKVPSKTLLVQDLPRNAMGKVVKGSVKTLFLK